MNLNKIRLLPKKTLLFCPFLRFSQQAPQPNPAKTPRKKRVPEEVFNLFTPSKKLEFDKNERCLIYYYKPSFYTYAIRYAKYLVPFCYILTLIKHNPWFLTFPASLPLMFVAEAFLLRRLYVQLKTFRQVISEIYIYKDGFSVELVYDHKFWRRVKNDDGIEFFYIPSIKTPPQGGDMPILFGDLFPEVYNEENFSDKNWGFAWTKYYRTPVNFVMIPKKYKYANMEVLVQIFNGRPIDASDKNIVEIDYIKKDKLDQE